MSRLKICDISFCETVSASEVQGGSSSQLIEELDLFDFLRKHIRTFKNKSSQERDGLLDEEFSDESGDNYGRLLLSKDGKKRFYMGAGSIDGVNYAVSYSRISS